MYECLPVPFGLVRFGVAPDHPDVKNCQDKFEQVASSPRFNFIGNIAIGKDLPLANLRPHYNAITFAYGATKDRKLGISSEDRLKGIYSARDFVGWYNGLPEHQALAPDLELGEEAVIIGQGNVALDVARTLLSHVDGLRKTDMTDQALNTLSKSRVKRVRVIGRRGPMQASFTIKEVRELLNLPSVSFEPIDPALFPPNATKLPRTPKRLTQLLVKGSSTPALQARKSWSLDFFLSPTSFNASNATPCTLSSLTFLRNEVKGPDIFASSATVSPTTSEILYPTSLAFRSIGYKSEAIEGMKDLGIDFDERRGIIPNDLHGRITSLSEDGTGIPGLYCSGWVKRGPAGVIANTMEDAFDTAESIAKDWENKEPFMAGTNGWDALQEDAATKNLRPVSWDNWKRIDVAEKKRGKAKGKEREKFTSIPDMLAVLD
ncbi:MAG: NADPH-adrenodoxin reductase [Alectoria fallacina]|uniref:NADPH:adrenodoxin oxidoreductase, mitochondrial n=1 Tax=Alectoria fallacina TaxID=1903189 RepID=A0A8H3GAU6_9LECA|nr:MAG: NADPH-adrenodoxin reductase [Alectoria fallacina]